MRPNTGRRSAHPQDRNPVWVGIVGGLVGLVVAYLLYAKFGASGDVPGELAGFTVVSDTLVQVRVAVDAPNAKAFHCVLRARDRSGAEIGRAVLDEPAGRGGSRTLVGDVATTSRSVTGELVGCARGPAPRPSP